MKSQAVKDLTSVIRANTERRSIEELAAKGKRHFRVVSGQKVLKLIQAIVDDAIEREAGELARVDRDRLVADSRREFDRVLKIQAEQDADVRRQRELADYFREQAEAAQGRIAALRDEVEKSRHRAALREGELNDAFQNERTELIRSQTEALKVNLLRLEKVERRLENAKDTIESYDREFERLKASASAAAAEPVPGRDPIARRTIRNLEEEVRVLTGRLASAQRALAAAGREREERSAPGLDANALQTIIDQIADRDDRRVVELESKFSERMDETLREVTRALHSATARPIDYAVEATDVLIDRLFDEESEMGTNLDVLAVEQRSAGQDIAGNLARLKAARLATGTDSKRNQDG
jgi:hypothetical protein